MSNYGTSLDLWKNIGEDAYTRVVGETLGTADGTTSTFSSTHENLISDSTTVYVDGSSVSVSSSDLDKGSFTLTSAPSNGTIVTADYSYTGVPDSTIQTILDRADSELESATGQKFYLQTSSEYIDVEGYQDVFFLKHIPVISLDSLSSNTASSIQDAPLWSAVTEGLGNDYLLDSDDGKIEFIDNKPVKGRNRLYATYVHGYSSSAIPSLVKELHRLYATRILAHNTVYQAYVQGRENFAPTETAELNTRIMALQKQLTKNAYVRV